LSSLQDLIPISHRGLWIDLSLRNEALSNLKLHSVFRAGEVFLSAVKVSEREADNWPPSNAICGSVLSFPVPPHGLELNQL